MTTNHSQFQMPDDMAVGFFDAIVGILENQRHLTKQGIDEILDLSYGFAEKGKRKYPKEQYREWGYKFIHERNGNK